MFVQFATRMLFSGSLRGAARARRFHTLPYPGQTGSGDEPEIVEIEAVGTRANCLLHLSREVCRVPGLGMEDAKPCCKVFAGDAPRCGIQDVAIDLFRRRV